MVIIWQNVSVPDQHVLNLYNVHVNYQQRLCAINRASVAKVRRVVWDHPISDTDQFLIRTLKSF